MSSGGESPELTAEQAQAMMASKAFVVMVAGAVWLVVGPLLVWRSRPRPYDPRAPLGVLA